MSPIRKRKSLGQHFLRDAQHAVDIAGLLFRNNEWDYLLEIGPGDGQLTRALLEAYGDKLWLIEVDERFAAELANRFPQLHGRIVQASVLDINWPEIFQQKSFAVIGNFPYQISTEIVFKVLEHHEFIPEVVGMFQREVAQRLAAGPGSKQYGVTSVLSQVYYSVSYELELRPEEFIPPPKVHSAVIHMSRRKEPLISVPYTDFRKVVKQAFNQRRKTLRNALKPLIADKEADPALLSKRAEQLSIEQFEYLTKLIME